MPYRQIEGAVPPVLSQTRHNQWAPPLRGTGTMPAMQIPTKPPQLDNPSRPKLGPLTHLTRTRTLPRRHLQGGARHETRRCRPILAGFWAFTREGERGWRGEDLGGTSREEERRQRRRCRRAGQANQTVSRSPKPHHRAHIRSGAHETQAAGDGGAEGVKEEGARPQIRRGGETPCRSQPPPAAHHPRGRAIRPEAPAVGAPAASERPCTLLPLNEGAN